MAVFCYIHFVLHLFSSVIKNFAKEYFQGTWESGDCVQSEEFQGGVKYLTYQALRSYSLLAVLTDVVPYRGSGGGGVEVNLYPDFLTLFPPLPTHSYCTVIYFSHAKIFLPRVGYSCNTSRGGGNTVAQSFFPVTSNQAQPRQY